MQVLKEKARRSRGRKGGFKKRDEKNRPEK
jgi:hypothetical protein